MSAERFNLIRKLKNPIPKEERYKYSIKDVGKDGFLKIKGKTYSVLPFGKFYDKSDEWFELKLTCIETGEETFLEWEEDDGLEIFLTIKELDFMHLKDEENKPIDEDDLDQITDDEDDIFYDGKLFSYEDDYKANYLRTRDGKNFKVYLYEFEAKDGSCITMENWSGNEDRADFEIWLSSKISKTAIEIISIGKSE